MIGLASPTPPAAGAGSGWRVQIPHRPRAKIDSQTLLLLLLYAVTAAADAAAVDVAATAAAIVVI